MLKALDVANFFIDLTKDDPEDVMTNLRVNKLLYFAQGWSLVRNSEPLFEDEIQAWKYGPVVPAVYRTFSEHGHNRIATVRGEYSPDLFSSEQLELLLDIAREYGQYTSSALVGITHRAGTPWKKVYTEGKNNPITQESMRGYFAGEKPLPTFEIDDNEDDYVGYRDPETGHYVLPADWDDDE